MTDHADDADRADHAVPSAGRPLRIPDPSLVVLIGASGSGKSTFARRHFKATEIVSSDVCRGLVADDDNDQSATKPAFELVHFIAGQRLAGNRLTVIDATSVQQAARQALVDLARAHHVRVTAIVFDLPQRVCEARNTTRPDRDLPPHVVRQQIQQLRRSLRGLGKEGFQRVHTLRTEDEVDAASIVRERLWPDRRDLHGPFDIIGDIHGCHDELVTLLGELGYPRHADGTFGAHPDGRTAVFLGDLVDRGPAIPAVLRTVMHLVGSGAALCVPGNHENKLGRILAGRNAKVSHGLAETLAQLDAEPPDVVAPFKAEVASFIDGLVSHLVLDDGRLVVAHAGLKEQFQGRASGAVRSFALYGDTTGETDEYGLPVRYPWADDYRGRALVVYGHTPVVQAAFHNNTICVDTGCVFGGSLTALRYPERELVSVPAAREYYAPSKPLAPPVSADAPGGGREPDLLDVDDVLGKRIIAVSLLPSVTIQGENATAALEVMSRFALDPHWLVHLPPTMAPTATSAEDGLLEHPREAFADLRRDGVARVVCEEKHMGSRAIVVVCRDEAAAARRFGVTPTQIGACFTRTGRSFFTDPDLDRAFLDRVRAAVGAAGLWDSLATDWVVLDAELLPWSFKAGDLLRRQYASVGAAATADLDASSAALAQAAARGVDVGELLGVTDERRVAAGRFVDAYRPYCWTVDGLDDLRLAPFQILAAEGEVHARRPHEWHLTQLAGLVAADPALFRPTAHRVVDLGDAPGGETEEAAIAWWQELTAAGGEGMVVKPAGGIEHSGATGHRLVQPGIKCRGPEYLRIIYGPEYDRPANLDRLRRRRLGHKRSLALREFALGIEALDRFVRHDPLYRVHECVFGVLALESEPVDPRL